MHHSSSAFGAEASLPAQVNEEKEARKVAAARLALAGGSFAAERTLISRC